MAATFLFTSEVSFLNKSIKFNNKELLVLVLDTVIVHLINLIQSFI